jgi:hypothetical protein
VEVGEKVGTPRAETPGPADLLATLATLIVAQALAFWTRAAI